MGIWVDTDFGFDDLWALLLLRHLAIPVDGLSLVAGNVPLPQVIKNAEASKRVFQFDWPVYIGAESPLKRTPETAERILGPLGMPSRGLQLPVFDVDLTSSNRALTNAQSAAVQALASWLNTHDQRHILALGPLTNIASVLEHYPDARRNISTLTWMGGSRGRGNHSQYAEYNALADPEALEAVARSGIPFCMIDLEVCRQVTFTEYDMPVIKGSNSQLLSDLLGGYLDIALSRGRTSMAVYDPIAALAVGASELFRFIPTTLRVHTKLDDHCGQTVFGSDDSIATSNTVCNFEYATSVDAPSALKLCFDALHNA